MPSNIRRAGCGFALVAGVTISFLPSLALLLIVFGMCLVNPARPDYYQAKFQMLFSLPDPGWLTWPCAAVVLLGLCLAVLGAGRALFRNERDRHISTL